MGSALVDRNTDLWVLNGSGEDSTFAPPKKEEEDPSQIAPRLKPRLLAEGYQPS